MKVKKIILTMVSTLILCAIAFSQTSYAATDIPDASSTKPAYFVSLTDANYNKEGENQYSIGEGDAIINKIGIVTNPEASNNNYNFTRIYDAYCARAQQGFEVRTTEQYQTNDLTTSENAYLTYIDRYNAKYELVDNSSQLKSFTNTSCSWNDNYDKILQLADLFFVGDDFEAYKNTTLKDAFLSSSDISLSQNIPDEWILTADQVRAIQQAALWYFTNSENTLYTNEVDENLHIKQGNVYKNLSEFNPADEEHIIAREAKALYDYLIATAEDRAESGETRDSIVYLYTNSDTTQTANTQPIIIIERNNKTFDLALRKYISSVTTNETTTTYNEAGERMPNVDSTDLESGEDTTATYKHRKDPVVVEKGSKVTYRLVIYNEGEIDGRATKVVDKLPAGVKFLSVVSGNFESDGTYTTTNNTLTLVRKSGETTDLPAYTSGTPANEVIEIECEVTADPDSTNRKILTNIAWIAEDYNDRGIADRDSVQTQPLTTLPNLVTTNIGYTGKDTYTEEQLRNENHYFKGQEDDDDFEKIVLLPKKFDLALRKFITKIESGDVVTEYTAEENRVPRITGEQVTKSPETEEKETTTAEKKHTKEKLLVKKGDKVTYTIRIYNEGQVNGYAAEVTDYLPDGLSLIPRDQSEINTTYNWVEGTDDNGKAIIKSTYLKDNNKVITAANYDFNKLKTAAYYQDLLVECVVNEFANKDNLKNIAAITKYEDEDKNEVYDIDSDKDSIIRNDYNPKNSEEGLGEQDDDDFEDLKLVELDLALRKFITRVGKVLPMTDENSTPYSRQPYDETSRKEVSPSDIVKLYNGEITTAEYKHQKNPVPVSVGDYVEYTLRVYNEGSMDGYAKEITDHLPKYLKYVDCPQNTSYDWVTPDESDLRTIKTNYLDDTKLSAVTATTLDNSAAHGKELKIICQVVEDIPVEQVQTNIAEITLYGDKDNNDLTVDRDSQTVGEGKATIPDDENLPNYKGNESNQSNLEDRNYHYKGQQDDDDFEKIYVPNFDLALRKFITKVEKVNEDGTRKDRYTDADYNARVPKVSGLEEFINNDDVTTLKYSHSKEPMDTVKNDIVTYTIRVYNEGSIPGYASVITDDIPDGVEFLPEDATNITYKWKMYAELPEGATAEAGREMVELNINGSSEVKKYVETTDVSKAKIIRTDYLSQEQGEARMKAGDTVNPSLIKAFDITKGLSDTNPDYRDVKVAFRVTEDYGSERIIINYAQISEDDNDWDIPDRDSTPDKWIEGEDDQDIEKIKVPQFDLALRKWVTQAIVTENGQTTVTETGHQPFDDPEEVVKVELHRKKLSNVTVKFRYSIRVYNDGYNKETGEALPGYIAGYAKEVKDHIPEGLKFLPEDNPDWKDEGNNIITTRKLENTLLKPGEFADVEVVLTWINGNDNLGLKINYAEISEDDNDWDVPDKDSTPDNMKERHEDDDDEAPVILSVSTGVETTYFILGLAVLITIAGGIALIKKFVM